MTALSRLTGKFAAMLDPDPASEGKLLQWIGEAHTADLPHLHSFTRGLEPGISAATAAVTKNVTVHDSKRFAEPLALPRSCPLYVRDHWASRTRDRNLQ
jgi:hypothetical protein